MLKKALNIASLALGLYAAASNMGCSASISSMLEKPLHVLDRHEKSVSKMIAKRYKTLKKRSELVSAIYSMDEEKAVWIEKYDFTGDGHPDLYELRNVVNKDGTLKVKKHAYEYIFDTNGPESYGVIYIAVDEREDGLNGNELWETYPKKMPKIKLWTRSSGKDS